MVEPQPRKPIDGKARPAALPQPEYSPILRQEHLLEAARQQAGAGH